MAIVLSRRATKARDGRECFGYFTLFSLARGSSKTQDPGSMKCIAYIFNMFVFLNIVRLAASRLLVTPCHVALVISHHGSRP